MIAIDKIQRLHDRYLELVRLEVEEFGVKATEVRHLIGRLGEFHCALKVGGSLACRPNQPGFDVVCPDGRRISVKATAQTSGFVAISQSTISDSEDLMVVQYLDGSLRTLYFGPTAAARGAARFYAPSANYELELTKARALALARFEESKTLLMEMEGGSVETARRNEEYLVLINQSALMDFLDPDDREGVEPTVEHSFQSLSARDEYIRSRGWSSAV